MKLSTTAAAFVSVLSLALAGAALTPAPASARYLFQQSFFNNNSTTCDTHSYGGGSFRTTCR